MAQAVVSHPGGVAEGAPPAAMERPDFQIVPRAGLPIVAAVLVALIVAIAVNVLGPIIGKLSIPARVEFTTKLMPKMVLIMPTVVTVTLAAGWQLATHLGYVYGGYHLHSWIVARYIVVGIMAVIALGLLEPANIAVLVEMKKPRPNPEVIERLMKRFIYTAGATGLMQVATFVIMTHLATG